MARDERPTIQLEDGERNLLHAGWSRSGKRLVVSVVPRGRWHEQAQVELDPEKVAQLSTFLTDTVPPARPAKTTSGAKPD
jgi:hypothetical protein